jgi:hypothetical protein
MDWAKVTTVVMFVSASGFARTEASEPSRLESMDDAWWTGPLLAATPSTLPQGHFYFEPYLFDIVTFEHFDSHGNHHSTPRAQDIGSQSYLNYGLFDRVTVGLIPRFGYVREIDAASSSGVQVGDLTLQAQYRLLQFEPGQWIPTVSFNLQETLPTGRYDRLNRLSDGLGSGAYSTIPSLYSQTYFWLPNGRILRTRLDLSYAMPSRVSVKDLSVYGTAPGFRGHAVPGNSSIGDLAFEFSATSHWVPALDIWYERDANTRAFGSYQSSSRGVVQISNQSSNGWELILAPGLEVNWSARVGIILGARVIVAGSNETASFAPVIAFSYFH